MQNSISRHWKILKESLPRLAHKPLAHLSYLGAGQVEAYWLDEIAQDLADESSLALVSRRSGRIDGLALCIDSPWDTQAVKRRIAIVKHLAHANNAPDSKALDDLLTEVAIRAARRGVECLTCKVQARDSAGVRALERQGFLLMDTLVDLVFDSSRTPLENIRLPNRPERLQTRLARPEDPPVDPRARPQSVCEAILAAITRTPKCRPERVQRFMINGCVQVLRAGRIGQLSPRSMGKL